jgi:hypothetical protein
MELMGFPSRRESARNERDVRQIAARLDAALIETSFRQAQIIAGRGVDSGASRV